MPFVFLVLGVLFLVVAIQGTQRDFFQLVQSEFSGPNNFVVWALAILILGALGYIRRIRPIADALVGLVILAMVLNNRGGFVGQFTSAFANPVAPSADTGTGTLTGGTSALAGASGTAAQIYVPEQQSAGVPLTVGPAGTPPIQIIPGL